MSVSRIPVVLFTYNRPAHLKRTLDSLKRDQVRSLMVFSDGKKGAGDAEAVRAVRQELKGIDWCEVCIVERETNLGLGRNVLAGVSEVAGRHEAFIVWEDDLVCVPGTYEWITAALRRYGPDERVMSVTAWTHPRVTPRDVGGMPYFDGRAECWVWGTWARSWRGMVEESALEKMRIAEARVAPDLYGADLPIMAKTEKRKNIWAVRWLYHHLQHGGLCLRPPWSMVEHTGFDPQATFAADATEWANPPLRDSPLVPDVWPEVREHPHCRELWAAANRKAGWRFIVSRVGRMMKRWNR